MVIPGTSLLTGGGKTGILYVLNTANLGKETATDSGVVQEETITDDMRGGPAYWQRSSVNGGPLLYSWGANDWVKAYSFNGATFAATPSSQGSGTQIYPGGILALSANSDTPGSGVLWATVDASGNVFKDAADPGILYAFDANNVATELWNSTMNSARDNYGNFAKYVPPLVANGKVYVATFSDQVVVYGLLASSTPAATPTFSPAAGTYGSAQSVQIADATSGATIYYTTNGTTPTTGSSTYSGAITVSASETLQAIAVASGYATSAVGSAAYVINSTTPAATPTFSPAAGTYSAAQSVQIADATSGATIYYTTNGMTPTTSSSTYSGTITVSASETLQAIAVASGYATSAVGSAAYTISGSSTTVVNDPTGFSTATGLSFLGGASLTGGTLELTDGGGDEARAVWYATPVNVQNFTTDFNFQITPASASTADGFTFTLQNSSAGAQALGAYGGSLGYAGIGSSVAVKFDLYNNDGEGSDSTGFYTDGASPMIPAVDMTASGVNLHSGDVLHAHITYNGTTLTLTLTDTVTNASFTTSTTINIPTTVGANTAYVGFTAGTGGETVTQEILNWTYVVNSTTPGVAATPTFSPAAGTYSAEQSVQIADTTSGATIYYTTNGTTPTTSSATYSGAITVSASETLQAIAVASGYATSAVGSAAYTIGGSSTTVVNDPTGFSTSTGLSLVGGASLTGGALELTDGGTSEARAVWYATPVNVQNFTTDFNFQLTPASANTADGFTFTLQNSAAGVQAVGGHGGNLGYAGIGSSVAVKFDLFNNDGEGSDSTGFYTDGASPMIPAVDMTASGVNLHSGDILHAHITYDGTTLTLTLTDTVTNASFTTSTAINIPTTVGANTAYVGFTAGTGDTTVTQEILNWTYVVNSTTPGVAATPTFSPAAGTYSSAQSVQIADATPGATIYYTTNGTTPTTSSATYSGAITVSASETLQAIAVASGYATSAVGSAAYVINSTTAATPTFSPAAGTYSAAQSVQIADTTSGATIYYTTNGTTPTTSSATYSGAITVSASETLQAIAVASGYATSAVGSAAYTIGGSSTTVVNDPTGFSTSTGLSLVGGASLTGGALELTDGGTSEARAVWYATPVNVQNFTTDFNFQLTPASANTADGFTFTLQNSAAGVQAVGGHGGNLGYAGIGSSVAVKFDLFNNDGEGSDSTGFYTDGASPMIPAVDMTASGVNLHSGDILHAHITYDGTTLTLTLTDTVTNASFTTSTAINIPTTVGANTAYVGFTAGTGDTTVTQEILNWTYVVNSTTPGVAATPTFSPAAGTYSSAQSVQIADATPGATIYYTTNGTTPTTSSAAYSGAITVSASETLQAIAAASGYTTSAVGSAVYVINSTTAATPTFSPAAGAYSAEQSVQIADATSGATIYYTTNGTTPTTSSATYSGAITVSASETLQAIAVASGYATSAVGSAAYTIGGSSTTVVNDPTGFSTSTGLSFLGGASLTGGTLELTDGGGDEARAVWYATPVNVQNFTTDFNFQITPASASTADGFTFTLQNSSAGVQALGAYGGSLGYAGIGSSVAVKFDLYNNDGEGSDSTGFYTDGASPMIPAVDMTASGVNLHSGDVLHAHITYNGTTLTLTLTDTVTNASFTTSTTINIPTTVGANTAYVGFTAGTGGETVTQEILNWTYVVN